MEPVTLTFNIDSVNEQWRRIGQDFCLWAEPKTVFRLPENCTTKRDIHFKVCREDPQNTHEGVCIVPLDKLHTVNVTSKCLVEIRYSLATNKLYLVGIDCWGSPMPQATARGNTFTVEFQEANWIFFHQKTGISDKFAPDTTGYFLNPQFFTEHSVDYYRWGSIWVIKDTVRKELQAEYNRLKSIYKRIPPTVHGACVIPEHYWKEWQVPEGYATLREEDFERLPAIELFRIGKDVGILMDIGCKFYTCGNDYYLDISRYVHFPKEWTTIGGFLLDPKVIENLPHVRELLADFESGDAQNKIRKALCATV